MKKFLLPAACVLALAACSGNNAALSGGMDFGSSLLKNAADSQCRAELNKRDEWRLVALAMSAAKQKEWEDKICGCAVEEVPKQMTADDVLQAANPATRNRVVAELTAKTVTACVKRLYR